MALPPGRFSFFVPDSAGLCFWPPCRSMRSAAGQDAIQSGGEGFRLYFSLVTDFRATCSPLISGKHPPGITNDAFFGPDPQSPLRSMWAIVPFDVGRDYAMWASITVKQKMRPTSQRNPGPHHTGISGPLPMESLAHMDRNTQTCLGMPAEAVGQCWIGIDPDCPVAANQACGWEEGPDRGRGRGRCMTLIRHAPFEGALSIGPLPQSVRQLACF